MADMDWRYMGFLDPHELEYLAVLKDRLEYQVLDVRHTRSEIERLRRRAGTRARRGAERYPVRIVAGLPVAGLTPSPDDAQLNTQ